MFQTKLRGIVVAVVAVVVLVGAAGFGVLRVLTANRLLTEARTNASIFDSQIRSNSVLLGVHRIGSARTWRRRRLINEAESVQEKLRILQAGRKELMNTVEEVGTVARLLLRKNAEVALDFYDGQMIGYQSRLDDLFRRLSVRTPVFANFKKRRNGRI